MAFSDLDQERIRYSIREAERQTRGEIVPMIVERSARYRETQYRAGAGCALFMLSALITIEWEGMSWGWQATKAGWLLLTVFAAYGLGFWLGTFDPVIRILTSNERMAYKVNLRAHQAFLEHGLHRTELGTGVLILISLLEHRIEILTDRTILDRVPPETWKNMLALIQEGFRKGNPVESLCQAITLCGEVLSKYFPVGPTDHNPNELPNDLIPG